MLKKEANLAVQAVRKHLTMHVPISSEGEVTEYKRRPVIMKGETLTWDESTFEDELPSKE